MTRSSPFGVGDAWVYDYWIVAGSGVRHLQQAAWEKCCGVGEGIMAVRCPACYRLWECPEHHEQVACNRCQAERLKRMTEQEEAAKHIGCTSSPASFEADTRFGRRFLHFFDQPKEPCGGGRRIIKKPDGL